MRNEHTVIAPCGEDQFEMRLVAVLIAVLLVNACGAKEEVPASRPAPTQAPGSTLPTQVPEYFRGDRCAADVSLSGAVNERWHNDGVVAKNNREGPPTIYHSAHGLITVTAYASGNGVKQFVYVTRAGRGGAWESAPDTPGLKIGVAGQGARFTTTVVDSDDNNPPITVTATFTC